MFKMSDHFFYPTNWRGKFAVRENIKLVIPFILRGKYGTCKQGGLKLWS